VFVTLDGLGVVRKSPRLWWTSESLYCPLIRGDLILETELDFDDRSNRFRVERDPALCELLNGDVGHFCGELNFGNKSYITCACLLRFIYCSCSSLFLHRV
jgi:hypothetical protein